MAIAREVQRQLPSARYKVLLTKKHANACPTFEQRVADTEYAKAFVSIHVDAPNLLGPLKSDGTLAIYNSRNPESFNLAEHLARSVSTTLRLNNRGTKIDNSLAVLSRKINFAPLSVILESARLSGLDERTLHAPGAVARIGGAVAASL